ncbi:hypothetical protein SUGI_0016440 [Cryptomeria japonica]|nr:hypothetical protein SUGI_0016440 [Cryptomeria japonica]
MTGRIGESWNSECATINICKGRCRDVTGSWPAGIPWLLGVQGESGFFVCECFVTVMAGRGPRPTSSVLTPYAAPVNSDSESDHETPSRPPQQQPHLQSRRGREWINDEEWIINIPETSDVTDLRSPSDVSIFRVPDFLKE